MSVEKLKNPFNSFSEIVKKINEIIDNIGGGGGGDVTKEYVDTQDNALSARISSNANNIVTLNNNKADKSEINNKLDKLTDTGEFVYSHDGDVQTSKGFEVSDEPSGSAAHVVSSKTVKAVKTYLEAKMDAVTAIDDPGEIVNNSGGLSGGTNYDSNVKPQILKRGKFACFTCQLKFKAASYGATWTNIYTLSSGNRPVKTTPFTCQIYNGTENESAGGTIKTNGTITLWTNAKPATDNYQIRINTCFKLA